MSLTLPFFLVAWFRYGHHWQRALAPLVLVAAAVPIVYSLNRGLWLSLAVGAIVFVALQLRTGNPLIIGATVIVALLAVIAILASPLSSMVQDRLDNQHSNDRRSQLLVTTVQSTAQGSPMLGFGSTRDVQGSFASIAGGSTPDCPACGVPPLGTQGQLWMVIFSQGFVGMALFLAFFLAILIQIRRCRTLVEKLCLFVLLFFGMQLFVYDTLDIPMYTVMATIGLAWREHMYQSGGTAGGSGSLTLEALLNRVRRGLPLILVATLTGAGVGFLSTLSAPTIYSAKTDILLTPTPRYLAAVAGGAGTATADTITIDTEAALVFSQETLERLPQSSRPDGFRDLRERVRVSPPPNTSILTIEVQGPSAEGAQRTSRGLVAAYLDSRSDYLEQRREQVLTNLQNDMTEIDATIAAGRANSGPAANTAAIEDQSRELQEAIGRMTLATTDAGEVVRVYPAQHVRKQAEVAITSGAAVGFLILAIISVMVPRVTRVRHLPLRASE